MSAATDDGGGEGYSDWWGYAAIILTVASLQAISFGKTAEAKKKAAEARAKALEAYAAELKTLLTKRLHSMQLDYHSQEHDILNKQGGAQELLLARADQLIGKTTAATGSSGVKAGEGTTHDLVVSQRGQGQEALAKLMQQMSTGVDTRSAKQKRSRTLLTAQSTAEINRIEKNAQVMRENATTMYNVESNWGVLASFVSGAAAAYGAFSGLGGGDGGDKTGETTGTSAVTTPTVKLNQGSRTANRSGEGPGYTEKSSYNNLLPLRESGLQTEGDLFQRFKGT